MASLQPPSFPTRTNSRLDSFLRRHLSPQVYDAIRAYEPCIVLSDSENYTFKFVVLSDRLIYLTENPPKSIRRVVALRDVVAIDLIDDYPEFLSGPNRETNQHIRIIYSSDALKKECEKSNGVRKFLFPFHHANAKNKKVKKENTHIFWRHKESRSQNESSLRCTVMSKISKGLKPTHGNIRTVPAREQHNIQGLNSLSSVKHQEAAPSWSRGLSTLPTPSRRHYQFTPANGKAGGSVPSCTANTKELWQLPNHKDSLSKTLLKGNGNGNVFYLNSSQASSLQSNSNLEKKESELHLYIVSTNSSIFLHLKSSWNNYIIKATLLQDPLYTSGLSPTIRSQQPYRSEEKIKHFSQLKSELFLKDNTLRKILDLITELKIAAQENFILKKLFWKTSDLFYFLVNKLHEYLPESRHKNALQNKSQRADELVICIEIIQTLGMMFRETETELSRLNTLAATKGALFNLLVILISEPQIPKSHPVFDIPLVADSTLVEMTFDAELQKLILEYTDTATSLLYEILLVFQQGNLGLGSRKFAIHWMMSFLQSHPSIITFVASIVKQVVKWLSASFQLLSPCQAVLLYQQFYILKSCLQYSKTLAEYIRNDYREEFRYFIHMPALEKRLPLCYPITQPTTQLIHEVLNLVEEKQSVKC